MARLFLSTDDDAPVVAGNDRGCLVNLLKKCLIEGYGSKLPVGGWTMPYADAEGHVGAFRNDHEHGGLGHFLRLGPGRAGDYYNNEHQVAAYESMSGPDDGLFPYAASGLDYQQHSVSTNAVPRPWALLAAKTWLALFVWRGATTIPTRADAGSRDAYGCVGFWFGDIEAWNQDDAYHSMLVQVKNSANDSFGSTGLSSANNYYGGKHFFPRASSGVVGSNMPANCFLPHPLSGAGFGAVGPEGGGERGLLVARAALSDGQANGLRGWFPEMLVPLHPRPFENLERVEISGETWLALCFSRGYGDRIDNCGQVLFRLDAGE